MQQELDWMTNKWDAFKPLEWQAQTASHAGKLREAAQFASRAVELAKQRDKRETAASLAIMIALRQALVGQAGEAQSMLAEAGKLSSTAFTQYTVSTAYPFGALALALSGATQQAQASIEETALRYPNNTLANGLWLPVARAALELQQGRPERALEQLQSVAPYEAAAFYCPGWLRGQAYLALKRGPEAAREFQKIITQRGGAPVSIIYPLAHLGLARAEALSLRVEQSHKHYEEFFAFWKNADADLPVLIEAKKEYARLN
jgi:tetratricopeptide (TPR) repeat protein